MVDKAVEAFYDACAQDEWERLARHRMEFATTWRAMQEFIPPGSTILDIGGGPGRYAIWLAKGGHRVTLLDLSAENLRLAESKAREHGALVEAFVHGDALELAGFRDGSFDVALLMGPLYHLLEETDRRRALAEAVRILKPDGVLFASFITRYAFLIDALIHGPRTIGSHGPQWEQLLRDGTYVVSDENPGFTNAYFAHPTEVQPLMESCGLIQLRLAAAEGFLGAAEPSVDFLTQSFFERWANLCYRLGTDPVVWGTAEHLLYVGRKPTATAPSPGGP